jgi:SH3-like domain-containing protein
MRLGTGKTKWIVFSALAFLLMGIQGANGACVRAPEANLRVGPGAHYEVAWTVYRYFPLRKVGTSLSGRWYAVEDIDGDIFWIHRSLITEQYRCGAVSSAKVNVRTGPGVHFGKVFLEPAEKFYSFRVLQRKGAWIKVRDMDNNTGWVRRDYCRIR